MRRVLILTFLILSLLALPSFAQGQEPKTPEEIRQYVDQRSKELWHVYFSESVDSIRVGKKMLRHGPYTLAYKGNVVEKGSYDHGNRVGNWVFRNYHDMVELRYDYTLRRPMYILQHENYTYDKDNNPCIFLGSPVVPFYFIMANVFYPQSEADNKHGGDVTLTINVDPSGRMSGYYIKQSSTPRFAKAVEKAADRIPRDEWRWVPAKKDGKNVDGEYDILIYFDN